MPQKAADLRVNIPHPCSRADEHRSLEASLKGSSGELAGKGIVCRILGVGGGACTTLFFWSFLIVNASSLRLPLTSLYFSLSSTSLIIACLMGMSMREPREEAKKGRKNGPRSLHLSDGSL